MKFIKGFLFVILVSFTVLSTVKGADTSFFYESNTVNSSTAEGIHSTALAESSLNEIMLSVETNSIRFRVDSVAPTSSEGHLVSVGDFVTITGINDCRNFKFISTTGSAVVKLTYFRK